MTRLRLWLIVGAVVLVSLAGWQYWHSHHQDKKADADVAKSVVVDAQHKEQTKASAKVDTVIQTIYVREKSREAAAKRLIETSDTVGQFSMTLRDSSSMWHLRWELVGMALDSTVLALGDARERADSLFADRNRWKAVADSAVPAMDALRKDLAVARSGCRVIPFVPCLSRKQSLVVGLVVGAVAYAERDRLFHHSR